MKPTPPLASLLDTGQFCGRVVSQPTHYSARPTPELDSQLAVLDLEIAKASRLAQLERDIARTDTVMLQALKAGFERVGSLDCMESARLCQAELVRRTDASCEKWARNLGMKVAVQS